MIAVFNHFLFLHGLFPSISSFHPYHLTPFQRRLTSRPALRSALSPFFMVFLKQLLFQRGVQGSVWNLNAGVDNMALQL